MSEKRDLRRRAHEGVSEVARTVWGMTVDGIAFALKWSAAGGVLGAVAGGGAGLYVLGLEGLLWGLAGGAVLGAVLALGILLVAGADSSLF